MFKKEERRGWSYWKTPRTHDRVVEMINGVEAVILCTTTLSDPSWKENDLQLVGSGKPFPKVSLYQLQQRRWVRQAKSFLSSD